jgi:hypothetical protein
MILGASHLALSYSSSAHSALRRLGFTQDFAERDVPNASQKQAMLRDYSTLHDLAFFRHSESVSMETIDHHSGRVNDGSRRPHTGYQPVLAVSDSLACEAVRAPIVEAWSASLREARMPSARLEWVTELGGWVWVDDNCQPGLRSVVLPIDDVASEAEFWTRGLGARPQTTGRDFARLTYAGPVSQWRIELILVAGQAEGTWMLDQLGFPCLALLSNAIDKDLAKAVAAGGHDDRTFSVTVNRKPLDVALLRSPNGAIVELLQVRR